MQERFSLRLRLQPFNVSLWAEFLRTCVQWSPKNSSTHLQVKEMLLGRNSVGCLKNENCLHWSTRQDEALHRSSFLKMLNFLKSLTPNSWLTWQGVKWDYSMLSQVYKQEMHRSEACLWLWLGTVLCIHDRVCSESGTIPTNSMHWSPERPATNYSYRVTQHI